MKKKEKKQKSPYAEDDKVRIRQSYYTFAKEYPSRILSLEGKRIKGRKKRAVKKALTVLFSLFLVCLSFFTANVLIDISYRDKEKLDASYEQTEPSQDSSESPLLFGGEKVKALYMPWEKLSDSEYVKEFAKEIRKKNCNSVVIDFKTEEGKLIFSSLNEHAIAAKTAVYDNNTVRQALDIFEEKEIKVIARVFCFEDPAVSQSSKDFAVKYMNTDINWLDSSDENGGKSRLNPYSEGAREYLFSVVSEILSFKVDGILLEEVSFPTGEYISGATYPGESKKSARNKTLKSFITQVKALLPAECLLLLGHSADDVLTENKELYYGNLLTSDADAFAVDTLLRDEKYILDKKTDYTSVFSLFTSVKNEVGEKTAVYRIDISEYSRSYLRKMEKSGFDNYIIFSENGAY